MGNSRIDEDGITKNGIDIGSISVQHFYVVVLCQICGGNFGESGIDFGGNDRARGANHFSHNRGLVTRSASTVKDALARAQFERGYQARDHAGLAIV